MAAADTAVPELLTLKSVKIEPNECAITAPLALNLKFTLARPVENAYWAVQYVVDSVRRRHVIELGKTAPASLAAGDHTMDFSAASVNVSGLKPSRLATAGILACSLRSKGGGPGAPEEGDVEHAAVNMVVQVETDDGAPAKRTTPADSLIRTVFDPLA